MPWTNEHLKWLVKTRKTLKTVDGKAIQIWEFRHNTDASILSKWAKHFRNHYCLDTEIDYLRAGIGCTRKEYLESIKFPDSRSAPGPSIRAGDVAEIIGADYLEYVLGFWVPRTRYGDKDVRNESTKGSDVIGFYIHRDGRDSKEDTLALYEIKAQFSAPKAQPRLQDAVDGSAKDHLRRAEALNAVKQRLFEKQGVAEANKIDRFQNPDDRPYKEIFGAVAMFCESAYSRKTESLTDTRSHPNRKSLDLLIVYGKDMMSLVHDLYRRAADEA